MGDHYVEIGNTGRKPCRYFCEEGRAVFIHLCSFVLVGRNEEFDFGHVSQV